MLSRPFGLRGRRPVSGVPGAADLLSDRPTGSGSRLTFRARSPTNRVARLGSCTGHSGGAETRGERDPPGSERGVVRLMRRTTQPLGAPRRGMSRYARWAQAEHREGARILTSAALAGPVFLGLIPWLVASAGRWVDRRLALPALGIGRVNGALGGFMAVAGVVLGLWAVDAQLTRGRGTPLPLMPTQELLTEGPFRCCRNPMTLGAILAYLGIAIATRTTAGIGIVIFLAAALLVYLKRLEEPELAERFGEAYLSYRRETSFILPRLLAPR